MDLNSKGEGERNPSSFCGLQHLMAPHDRTIHLNFHDMYTQAASTLIWELFKERTVEKPPSHARRGPACVQAPCTCRPRSELAVPQRPAASARHGPRASAPPELPYGFLPYILARGIALPCGSDPLKPYTGHEKPRARAEDCPRSLPLD